MANKDPFVAETLEFGRQFLAMLKLDKDMSFVGSLPEELKRMVQSCVLWTGVLQNAMSDVQVRCINHDPNEAFGASQLDRDWIRTELQANRVIQIECKTVGGAGEHCFSIVPDGKGNARILHAALNHHQIKYQQDEGIPIDCMVSSLRDVGRGDKEATQKLFGHEHHSGMVAQNVFSGTPVHSLESRKLWLALGELVQNRNAMSQQQLKADGAASGALAGFLCAVVGECLTEDEAGDTTQDRAERIGVGAASGAVGGYSQVATSQLWTGCFLEHSVFRAGTVCAALVAVVSLLHNSSLMVRGKITEIQFRRKMASGLGGAAAGAGGASFGAAALTACNFVPGGWVVLGGMVVGGIIGGWLGSAAGNALDRCIWDGSEDSAVHIYQFFGFNTPRNAPRKEYSEDEILEAFKAKVEKHPKDEKWMLMCREALIGLVNTMYPAKMSLLIAAIEDLTRKERDKKRA